MNQPTFKQIALAAQEVNFSQQFSSLKCREIVDYKSLCNRLLTEDADLCESIISSGNADAFIRNVEANVLAGRQVFDGSAKEALGLTAWLNPFLNASYTEEYPSTKVRFFDEFSGNYVFQGYRSTAITIENMVVTPNNAFEIKNQTVIYSQDKFSIGFNYLNTDGLICGFGLMAVPSNRGMKGKGRILLTALTDNTYIIDDASKYAYADGTPFPVELLLKGLSL